MYRRHGFAQTGFGENEIQGYQGFQIPFQLFLELQGLQSKRLQDFNFFLHNLQPGYFQLIVQGHDGSGLYE